MYAPLSYTSDGSFGGPIVFNGVTFGPGPVRADYKFSNYRLSYLWPYRSGRLNAEYGLTLFVRDARIGLSQIGASESFKNVGLVPLLHLGATYDAGNRWKAVMDFDFLEARQGRVYDLGLTAAYGLNSWSDLTVGLRSFIGGVSIDDVFNSATVCYLTAGVTYRF